MQTVTVGSKNQIVIPLETRKKIVGLKPGRKVSIYALSADTIAIKISQSGWLENARGAMRGAWNVSAASELEAMRDEWNEK